MVRRSKPEEVVEDPGGMGIIWVRDDQDLKGEGVTRGNNEVPKPPFLIVV